MLVNLNGIPCEIKTTWDEESKCFVTESDHYKNVIGCGDTITESVDVFNEHLQRYLHAKAIGKVVE